MSGAEPARLAPDRATTGEIIVGKGSPQRLGRHSFRSVGRGIGRP